MKTYTIGFCPPEVIRAAVLEQCPDGYPMTIRLAEEWSAIAEAWNEGIDSHLEALTERSEADASTGKVRVHPEELSTLLRRLYEHGTDAGISLRGSILGTLGIDEV